MLILKHVSVTYLSVDGSVIERIGDDHQAEVALRGMVDSARAKRISIIASAVESPSILPSLWSCGVDLIQGTFVGPRSDTLDQELSSSVQLASVAPEG